MEEGSASGVPWGKGLVQVSNTPIGSKETFVKRLLLKRRVFEANCCIEKGLPLCKCDPRAPISQGSTTQDSTIRLV